jgi:hypothetical protein
MNTENAAKIALSVISMDSRDPWTLDADQQVGRVRDLLITASIPAAVVDATNVRMLYIYFVYTRDYPQYFLIKRGALRRGGDATYLVAVRLDALEGLTGDEMRALLLRAASVVILDVAIRSKYNDDEIFEWFRSIPGRDRFELG